MIAFDRIPHLIMEGGDIFSGPLGNVLLKEPFKWTPGFANVSERPSLGVEFDEAQLKKVIASQGRSSARISRDASARRTSE